MESNQTQKKQLVNASAIVVILVNSIISCGAVGCILYQQIHSWWIVLPVIAIYSLILHKATRVLSKTVVIVNKNMDKSWIQRLSK